jgi:hypothetical protein
VKEDSRKREDSFCVGLNPHVDMFQHTFHFKNHEFLAGIIENVILRIYSNIYSPCFGMGVCAISTFEIVFFDNVSLISQNTSSDSPAKEDNISD